MIGARAGQTAGVRCAIAAGMMNDPISTGPIPLIVILGDSNAAGFAGFLSSNPPPDQSNPGFNSLATQSTTYVYYDGKADPALDNPPVYTEVVGGVAPWPVTGPDHDMGVEITLGMDLTAQGLRCVLAKQGIVSLQCAQMVPSPSPAYPSSGPAWLTTLATFCNGLEQARGAQTQIAIVMADNNDGLDTTLTANIATNNSLLANGLVSRFPGLKAIIWIQINADTVNFPSFLAAAITNQTNWFSANPTVGGVPIRVVNWDALPLSDHAHGTPNSYMTLGQWLAKLARDTLGAAYPRPASLPQIIGYGPVAAANGTTQPNGWGGAEAGDLEILIDVQMVGSGTEGSTTTPSGWTSRGAVVSASGSPGFQTRLTIWSRVVDSAMLAANHAHTAATSVVLDAPNTVHWSQILTIRGPNANPTIDFVQLTGANATTTSFSLTGGSTSGAKRLLIIVNTGYPSPQVDTSVTLSGGNGTGNMQIKHGAHVCPDANLAIMDVQTQIVPVGATGTITVTLGGSNICPAGAVIAIAP